MAQKAMSWDGLNSRQQEYLQAVYEVDQEQEADERKAWTRGIQRLSAREWRWMEYGTFYGIHTPLKMKIFLRQFQDEGTGSTFEALERRGLITCKYTWKRKNGEQVEDRLLMVQITKDGRKLVRSATGAQREKALPPGTLREWHWRAMVEAWKARPAGLKSEYGEDYGHISWNTWLRLRDYKAGALIEEYQTWGNKLPHMSATPQIYWTRLSPYGEQFYRDNWQRYRDLYPDVDAPRPETAESEKPE